MSQAALAELGDNVKRLCICWFGANCDPVDRINELSVKTGINVYLLDSALCASNNKNRM
jgi:hypothetical protein